MSFKVCSLFDIEEKACWNVKQLVRVKTVKKQSNRSIAMLWMQEYKHNKESKKKKEWVTLGQETNHRNSEGHVERFVIQMATQNVVMLYDMFIQWEVLLGNHCYLFVFTCKDRSR